MTVRSSCPYCAQTNTRKDGFGYCKVYACFKASGKKRVLERLLKRAHNIFFLPESSQLGIRSYVTNTYSPRTREANDILHEANWELGFVPLELLDAIPMQHREKWDKNIRW